MLEAGVGPPVLAIHGLGATKGSFLPTVDALADHFRVIAVDLPGFGDSDKPIGAAYDPRFFADAIVDLLDALGLHRANLIGNSLGGRVALEVALREPERVDRLALLAPSLAWRRPRRWAPALRLVRPELGLVQLAPRPVVEAIVHRLIPGADEGWTAAGVDEFLRAYLTPAGRAAFYAAARQIYLEAPHGEAGFWTRRRELQPTSYSSGGAVTRSCRSLSHATSPTLSRKPVTSSWTADTCPRRTAHADTPGNRCVSRGPDNGWSAARTRLASAVSARSTRFPCASACEHRGSARAASTGLLERCRRRSSHAIAAARPVSRAAAASSPNWTCPVFDDT